MSQYDIKYTEIMNQVEQVKACARQLEQYREKVSSIRNVLKGYDEGIASFSANLDVMLSQMETHGSHLKNMEQVLYTSTMLYLKTENKLIGTSEEFSKLLIKNKTLAGQETKTELPEELQGLLDQGLISEEDLQYTDDGMVVCNKSMADILKAMGVDTSNQADGYYDDWYIYGTKDKDGHYVYGLFKMREQEYDQFDNNDPGITVSFIAFDMDKLKGLTTGHTGDLEAEINKVVSAEGGTFDKTLQAYFSDPTSDGSYLIADAYINKIAQTSQDGKIGLPENLKNIISKQNEIDQILSHKGIFMDPGMVSALDKQKEGISRVTNALQAINEEAGYQIYDPDSGALHIKDPNHLTSYEKKAILAAHTGDVNYNSFAAEVKFHSDALVDWKSKFSGVPGLKKWYNSAIRADMAIGEEYESGYYDKYYDLESDMVQEQVKYHGVQ